jgi:polar amino acid transport system substrate-binding protein
MALAIPLGLGLSLARAFGPRWAGRAASLYVEIYRGTPVLLQLYVLYYGLASVVRLGALPTAIVGLGMNYAAYEAEVYRAGIGAVPKGQMAAAYALGMSTPLALRRVLLPQAFRLALPNVTNDFIALLKDSSLVSVITVVELTKQMTITAVDVRSFVLPGLLCAALYFAMSYPLSRWSKRLEARMARA